MRILARINDGPPATHGPVTAAPAPTVPHQTAGEKKGHWSVHVSSSPIQSWFPLALFPSVNTSINRVAQRGRGHQLSFLSRCALSNPSRSYPCHGQLSKWSNGRSALCLTTSTPTPHTLAMTCSEYRRYIASLSPVPSIPSTTATRLHTRRSSLSAVPVPCLTHLINCDSLPPWQHAIPCSHCPCHCRK
jgi:hypothetical protein